MGVRTWGGGDKIQRKIFFSVSLMFTFAIFLIVATSSAAVVNQSNTIVKNISTTNIKTTGSSIQSSHVLTVAQMNDGLSRAQKFYNTNNRLPNYVSYGTTKILIAEFKTIIATKGLKINEIYANIGKPIYIASDNINNSAADNSRINNIIKGLQLLGLNAFNMGLGPNSHIKVLQSTAVPKNALVVDIYGGADAGTLNEMGSSWYKSIKGTRDVLSVFWPPSQVITGLSFLKRAADDNYDTLSFKGLANPDQYLLKNGYKYLYSGDISKIVNAIFCQATQ